MLPLGSPDRIHVAFDDHRLVANAGLLLPVTLAHHLGLGELVDCHVDLGDAPGRANPGDKLLTLVASALAGGDCIDDADVLRTGRTASAIGCVVKAPSTLGTFLRSFRWGHVRQLDRVSRELLARAWAAGGGPGDAPLTIDLDSTICETYGLRKEGARRHGYTGQRGYHPLLAVTWTIADTGDVLMVRLRQGRANTARGADHFLRETVGRVRYAGATGQLTVRADSGFYTHAMVAVCRKMDVRYSITIRQHQSLRNLIEAIPETDWTPIPYWMDGGADVAETEYTPFQHEPDAAPTRLIVRRVKPAPGFPTGAAYRLQLSRLHHRPGGRHSGTGGRPPPPCRDRERHPRPEVRRRPQSSSLGTLPRQRRLAGGAGHGPQSGSLDGAHRPGRAGGYHQDPAATLLLPGRTHHPQGPSPHPAPSQGLALGEPVQSRPGAIASPAAPFLTPPSASDPSTRPSNRLAVPRQAGHPVSPAAICPTILPSAATREPSASPWHSCLYPHPLESGGVRALHHHPRFSSLA